MTAIRLAGSVRAAQIFADVIEPIVYSELFRQHEGLAGQAHGTYARYCTMTKKADGGYAYDPITEQKEITSEGMGGVPDCGYVGNMFEAARANKVRQQSSGVLSRLGGRHSTT